MLITFGVKLYRKYIEIRNRKKNKFPHLHRTDSIRNNTVTLYYNNIYLYREEERHKKDKGTKIKITQSFKFKHHCVHFQRNSFRKDQVHRLNFQAFLNLPIPKHTTYQKQKYNAIFVKFFILKCPLTSPISSPQSSPFCHRSSKVQTLHIGAR